MSGLWDGPSLKPSFHEGEGAGKQMSDGNDELLPPRPSGERVGVRGIAPRKAADA